MSKKMTTSEPTSEIVKEITNQSTTHDIIVVLKMIVQYLESFTMDKMSRDVMSAAADRLKSQEREIAELKAFLEENRKLCALCASEGVIEQKAEVDALTARAEQAERERDAAIADMKLIADNVRETHCDETCCFACKYDCDMSTNDSGVIANECPGFYKDDCFEWRGLPQGGGGK